MEITPTAFRVLNYLNTLSGIAHPSKEQIMSNIGISNSQDDALKFSNALSALYYLKLADGSFTHVSINANGRIYLSKILAENEALCEARVFDNFEYALVEFLYLNNWGVRINEFPEILKTQAPISGKQSDEMQLASYLTMYPMVDRKNDEYFLNTSGKAFYNQKVKGSTTTPLASAPVEKEPSVMIKIGDNFSGMLNTGNQKDLDFNKSFNPDSSKRKPATNKKITSKWIWKIIAGIIAVALGVLKLFGVF